MKSFEKAIVPKEDEGALTTRWKSNMEVATEMVTTGLLPKEINTPQKALLVMQTGREIGCQPMEALRNIYIVSNKTALNGQLMLSLIYRSGLLEDIKIDSKEDNCTVTMQRKGMSAYTIDFGDKEAKEMWLLGKDNYKKQKKTMYRWRAISACARVVFPDVMGGMYLREEVEEETIVETTIATAEQAADQASPEKYDEFEKGIADRLEEDLKLMKEGFDVDRWRKSYVKELRMLKDADRESIEQILQNKQSELITGNEPVDEDKATIETYIGLADECKTAAGLRVWFARTQGQVTKDLSAEDFGKLVDYCKVLTAKLPDGDKAAEEAAEAPSDEIGDDEDMSKQAEANRRETLDALYGHYGKDFVIDTANKLFGISPEQVNLMQLEDLTNDLNKKGA